MKIAIETEQILIDILSKSFPNSSKNKIRKMLTEGRISVNGEIEHKAKRPLKKSDSVEILDKTISRELTPPPKQKPTNLNIIFEDEDILIVEKPAGLLSIATNKMEPDTLHSRCVDYVKSKTPENKPKKRYIMKKSKINSVKAITKPQQKNNIEEEKLKEINAYSKKPKNEFFEEIDDSYDNGQLKWY